MTAFADLPESKATGRIAEIYQEIRYYNAVPYVSSLQRQLATIPGCLEWLWDAIRSPMVDGRIPEAAWAATHDLELPLLPVMPVEALRVMDIDATAQQTLDDIFVTFLRASPINMVTASLLKHLLVSSSTAESVSASVRDWTPPPSPASLPGFPSDRSLDPAVRDLLALFAVDMGGADFVPGLYRLLANWPAYLAHLAVELLPLFDDPRIRALCREVEGRIDYIIPPLAASLSASPPPFDETSRRAILASLDVYRGTSPQMIVFSAILRQALPSVP